MKNKKKTIRSYNAFMEKYLPEQFKKEKDEDNLMTFTLENLLPSKNIKTAVKTISSHPEC
jgi:hypothetical protein